MQKFDVIIPAYNCAEDLGTLLKQTLAWNDEVTNDDIIVINDGSTDDGATKAAASYYEISRYYEQEHLGPCQALIEAMKHSDKELVVYCDSDISFAHEKKCGIELYGDSIEHLAYLLSRAKDGVAVVSPTVLQLETKDDIAHVKLRGSSRRDARSKETVIDNRRVYHLGIRFGEYGGIMLYHDFDWAPLKMCHSREWCPILSTNNIYAFKRSVYDEVGGYDESYAPGGRELHDDLILKMRQAGYMVRTTSHVETYHPKNKDKPEGDLTVDYEKAIHAKRLFLQRWDGNDFTEDSSCIDENIISVTSERVIKDDNKWDFRPNQKLI